MVMAAGLGTRLRPITYEVPKPMVPVLNRPVMEHIAEAPAPATVHGEVIANLHWFPDRSGIISATAREFGIELTYSHEEAPLGTAGGVRNVSGFFGSDPFLVIAATR